MEKRYELVSLESGCSIGLFDSVVKAESNAKTQHINHFEVWDNEKRRRVLCCDPYEGDDGRVAQALGEAWGDHC